MTHDHPIEWVWLAVTVFDTWISLSSWLAANRDWKRVAAEQKPLTTEALRLRSSRDAVTFAIEVSSGLNACLAGLLMTGAILALFLAPPPPSYMEVPQSLVLLSILISVSVINTIIAVYGRLVRYRLAIGFYERLEGLNNPVGKTTSQAVVDSYKKEPNRRSTDKDKS